VDEIALLVEQWRSKAIDYLRTAKSYQCRSQSETRGGLVKGACVLQMCANELEAGLAKTQAMGEVGQRPEAPERQTAPAQE
jgi:hypothetical protein